MAFEAWLYTLKLVVNVVANVKPKTTAAASRGSLATARLSCFKILQAGPSARSCFFSGRA